MTVAKKFTPPAEKKKIKLDMSSHILEELELYVQCGQEDYDWLTKDIVIEQLLEDALKKDRSFRSWLKKRKKTKNSKTVENHISNNQHTPSSGQNEHHQA